MTLNICFFDVDEFNKMVEYIELHDEFYKQYNIPPIKTETCGRL